MRASYLYPSRILHSNSHQWFPNKAEDASLITIGYGLVKTRSFPCERNSSCQKNQDENCVQGRNRKSIRLFHFISPFFFVTGRTELMEITERSSSWAGLHHLEGASGRHTCNLYSVSYIFLLGRQKGQMRRPGTDD